MDLNQCPECGEGALRQIPDFGRRKVTCEECGYREKLQEFLRLHG